jgi:hypothetical protein
MPFWLAVRSKVNQKTAEKRKIAKRNLQIGAIRPHIARKFLQKWAKKRG